MYLHCVFVLKKLFNFSHFFPPRWHPCRPIQKCGTIAGVKEAGVSCSSPLFHFWQDFKGAEKNNQEELRKSEHGVGKENFWTFSRKNIFWKIRHFCCILAMAKVRQSLPKLAIFMPDVCYFCTWCVCVLDAFTCGSYSPGHGDIPPYPNLEKIPKIRHCCSPQRWKIFLFEEKKS